MSESPATWGSILPCPFCDAPGQMLSNEAYHKGSGIAGSACVVCTRCGAGGPMVEPKTERPLQSVERQAVRLWNRRGSHQNASWKLRRIAQILGSDYVERA